MKRLPLSDEAGRPGRWTASGHQLALMMTGRRRLQRVIRNNRQWATCAICAPERLHDSFHERDKQDRHYFRNYPYYLRAPLRNRTVDLLLTIATPHRPGCTACTNR